MNRDQMIAEMRKGDVWDVIVIGGGATGLGTALDAASRGYRTVLMECSDFAKGTSSRSTKLIHGGVRYLRSGQVRMVTESLRERGLLLRNAPHVVHSMQFVVPAYRFAERWYFWIGMKLYDFLAGRLRLDRSRILSRKSIKELVPTLNEDRLRGGVRYCDGQFDDARLALCLGRSLANAGGVLGNYLRVTGLLNEGGKTTGVRAQDEESGDTFELRGKVVINATGVFGEDIMRMDGGRNSSDQKPAPTIVPSQGTHVVIDREFLPCDYGVLIPETDDGRVLFAIPWHGKTLVGTTDHAVDEILPDPVPLHSEVEYLLEHVGRYLTRQPKLDDVRSVFAGLRPLVGKPSTGGSNQSTASLSREHEIDVSPSNLITVIGGKWTTYRQMGEDVVDLAAKTVGLDSRESRTAELRLAGAPIKGEERSQLSDTDPLAVFGSDAENIQQIIGEDSRMGETLHERLPYLKAHVVLAARNEMARTIEDVLARRTRSLLMDATASVESAPVVAQLLAGELGRDEGWVQQQIATYTELARVYQVSA